MAIHKQGSGQHENVVGISRSGAPFLLKLVEGLCLNDVRPRFGLFADSRCRESQGHGQ